MSRIVFIRAWPRNAATGAAQLVPLAGGGSFTPYYRDGIHYRAGVASEPRFSSALGFDKMGWTGGALPTASVVTFAPADTALLVDLAGRYWRDAAIEVDAGDEDGGLSRVLTGTIADATIQNGQLLLTVADFGARLTAPAIKDYFAGTGGIEGAAVAKGRVKRRSYGRVFNVEGRAFEPAYNIYEFGDLARPLQGCTALRDMGRAGAFAILGWQGSIAATLVALRASVPVQGGGVIAPSIACAKWWTQPAGPLTADLRGDVGAGYVETTAAIAARLLRAVDGPDLADLAAAIALRPAAAGLHIGDDRETTAGALDRLFSGVSLNWRLDPAGEVDILPWSWEGDAEPVQGVFIGREQTLAPHSTRRIGYQRNHRLHNDGEIAADVLAGDITFPDGTVLSSVQPAEAGATNGTPPGSPAGPFEIGDLLDYVRSIPIDFANLVGRLAGAIEKVDSVTKSVRIGQGQVLVPGYDEWAPGADLPDGYTSTSKDTGTRRAKVPGDASNWAVMEITTAPDQLIGYEIDLVNAIGATWLELRVMATLGLGGLVGAVLNLNAFDANGAFIADAFAAAGVANNYEGGSAIKLSADPDTGNNVLGMGVVGKTYTWRKLVRLTATNVAKITMQVQTNSEFYGPSVPKVLTWHRAEVAIPSRAGTLTKINEARLHTAEGVLADADNLEVFFNKDGSVGDDESGAEFFIRAKARKLDGTFTSDIALGAQSIWILNPDVEGDYRKVFGVEGGVVYSLAEFLANSIKTVNLQVNAVTDPQFVQLVADINCPRDTYTELFYIDVEKEFEETVFDLSGIIHFESTDDVAVTVHISRDTDELTTNYTRIIGEGAATTIMPIPISYIDYDCPLGFHRYTIGIVESDFDDDGYGTVHPPSNLKVRGFKR